MILPLFSGSNSVILENLYFPYFSSYHFCQTASRIPQALFKQAISQIWSYPVILALVFLFYKLLLTHSNVLYLHLGMFGRDQTLYQFKTKKSKSPWTWQVPFQVQSAWTNYTARTFFSDRLIHQLVVWPCHERPNTSEKELKVVNQWQEEQNFLIN